MIQEKVFSIEGIHPMELYGTNNNKLHAIRAFFPKLKIIARGEKLTVSGGEQEVESFEKGFLALLHHLRKHHRISESDVESLLQDAEKKPFVSQKEEVLVHNNKGTTVRPKTANQAKMVESMQSNDLLFAVGPAGTGKTYTAVAIAVHALKSKLVKKIILTRPAVEAGETLGFLPGDMKEKLDPYMQPLYDALYDMVTAETLERLLHDRIIEIAPLAYMRGRTLDNAYVILDEAQNTTASQMRMFLTRMGKHAKFIVTGDVSQVDLPGRKQSGLKEALQVLRDTKGIAKVVLDETDVVRHKLVKRIIRSYEEFDT